MCVKWGCSNILFTRYNMQQYNVYMVGHFMVIITL